MISLKNTNSFSNRWSFSLIRAGLLFDFRIKTISGYAFAGSEHIEMIVLNDNPIKVTFIFTQIWFVEFD